MLEKILAALEKIGNAIELLATRLAAATVETPDPPKTPAAKPATPPPATPADDDDDLFGTSTPAAPAKPMTKDEFMAIAKAVSDVKTRDVVKAEVFRVGGVKKTGDLKPEQYQVVADALRKL